MSYWASNGAITCAENLERLDRKYRFSEFDAEHNEAIPRDLSADARLRNREEFYQFLTCGTLFAILSESEMRTGGWDAIVADNINYVRHGDRGALYPRSSRFWL